MTRFLLGFSGVLSLGSIAAFFLFVPPVLIAAGLLVTIALLPMVFMLRLGVRIEIQPVLPPDGADRKQ